MRPYIGIGIIFISLTLIFYHLGIQLKKDNIRINNYIKKSELYLGREILIGEDSVTILEYNYDIKSYYLSNGKYVDERIIVFKLK